MPGDPLRAKFIAEHYLEGAVLVNEVRGMYAYTGTYQGKPLSVMGSGMGIPSMGIYSYELFDFYDVDRIIRVGSSISFDPQIGLKDVVIGTGSCSESTFGLIQNGYQPFGFLSFSFIPCFEGHIFLLGHKLFHIVLVQAVIERMGTL